MQAGLEENIVYVLEHRDEVRAKAALCLDKIKRDNSPSHYSRRLELLYSGNVNSVMECSF